MAATQFLEEALNTDVDENAVTALVGSLETQLTDSHHNNGINGTIMVQKPGNSEDGEEKSLTQLQNASNPNNAVLLGGPNVITKTGDGVKIVTFPTGQQQVVRFPVGNGGVTTAGGVAPTFVIKGGVGGAQQLVNMGQVRGAAPQKPGQPAQRLVINSPQVQFQQMIRPGVGGQQQLALQAIQQLQTTGGSGHFLVKTESGQLQLIRVGPPVPPNSTAQPQNVRLQTVSVATTATSGTVVSAPPALTATTPAQKQQVDTTKEKCRKFLANLLELSTREPKAVERNVRTLIQELIDAKVEPEEFCDRLEKLLNASPQPCLIGFLKKSLPLLRQSLFLRLMTIDGIRPPPQHVVTGLATVPATVGAAQLAGTAVRPHMLTQTVRVVSPMTAAGQTINVTTPRNVVPAQRMVTPIRGQLAPGKVVTPLRGMAPSQPPPLHPTGSPMLRLTVPAKPAGKATGKTLAGAKVPFRPTAASAAPAKTLSRAVRGFDSAAFVGDDDINDVAAMGGVNLAEESQRILGSTEFVGTQIRSVKDELFLHSIPLQNKIRQLVTSEGLEEPPAEVLSLISHACQERLRSLVEKLACIAEHRIDVIKLEPRYDVTQDVKGQLKFLEELDRLERKRHEEHEREMLLRAAKSRSKSEDPDQLKLKAKAKEMQRAEMEELRQREANITALQAIGPRKKPRLDSPGTSAEGVSVGEGSGGFARPTQPPLRPRLKRVNLRDLLFLLEQEKQPTTNKLLYKSYLK